jgi:hypothetical protein
MNEILLILVACNLALTSILIAKFTSLKRSVRDLQVVYFVEEHETNGFIKKQKKIQIKAQLQIGNLPIGSPFLVSEQISETVDQDRTTALIENIAKPLSALGIKVITKGLI